MREDLKDLNHVLWAGCKNSQTSADALINGTYNGAFTYYFCRHVRDANGRITRADLLKRVRASFKYEHYSQVPQLEVPEPARQRKMVFQV